MINTLIARRPEGNYFRPAAILHILNEWPVPAI